MIIDQTEVAGKTVHFTQSSGGSITLLGTHTEEERNTIKQQIRNRISAHRGRRKKRPFEELLDVMMRNARRHETQWFVFRRQHGS